MNLFTSKAQTLQNLQGKLSKSKLLPQFIITYAEWKKDQDHCLKQLKRSNLANVVIVRSSSKNEDTSVASNAGKFVSIPDVDLTDDLQIRKAVENVFKSYDQLQDLDEVFIQPFIKNVRCSGVIFTKDLNSPAPYYVINYDSVSGRTDLITSGEKGDYKTRIIFKNHKKNTEFTPLLEMTGELEKIFPDHSLDIEFLVSSENQVYLLQVRPMVNNSASEIKLDTVATYLHKIHKKVSKWLAPNVKQLSEKNILAVMPDWNPAEIIGKHPRPLANSLYKEVITDKVWAYQRFKYGYYDTRSIPLIINLLGIPYIDVRASFNSFVPSSLNIETARKLVSFYINKLRENPHLHDKVEFNVVYSCYHFNIDAELLELSDHQFSKSEIHEVKISLQKLTKNILSKDSPFWSDLKKIDELSHKFNEVSSSTLPTVDKIYWLIEDCKRFGTLPFAGVARAAFIAVQLLRSLVEINVLSEKDYHLFLSTLNTVSKKLTKDHHLLPKEEFLSKYGHLRPGTYDICSSNYNEAYNKYFTETNQPKDRKLKIEETFNLSLEQEEKINVLLNEHQLGIRASDLFVFFREAIEGREQLKLEFTKNINEVLILLGSIGERFNFSRDQLSYLDITTVLRLYSELDHRDFAQILHEEIVRGQRNFKINECILLPDIIFEADDVYDFEMIENTPNFVTLKRFMGQTLKEEELLSDKVDLKNKIVFIQSADPGYDWIFTKDIGALVTKYGGANSHMAIRCAELEIPAVIGCGEQNYQHWSKYSCIDIDCENRCVRTV